MTATTIGEALLELKRRSGLSLNAIAQAAGYSGPSSVQAFFHPNYDPPALDVAIAHKLVAAFERRGSPPIMPTDVFDLTGAYGNRLPTPDTRFKTAPLEQFSTGDLPFYKTSQGGNLALGGDIRTLQVFMCDLTQSMFKADRPKGLAGARSAFGLYVADTAMSPRFNEGEPIFLGDGRAPSRGDDAMIVLRLDEPGGSNSNTISRAILGQVISKSDTAITLRQYHKGRVARIDSNLISHIYRIAKWAEVCGIYYA